MISYSENTAMYYLSEEKSDKQGICFWYENYPQRLYLNAISSKANKRIDIHFARNRKHETIHGIPEPYIT